MIASEGILLVPVKGDGRNADRRDVKTPAARGSTWRGWASRAGGSPTSVTSDRLSSEVAVRNRMFPKTRSWFALGAPLELLSPLSVLRIVYALAVVLWPLEGLVLSPLAKFPWFAGASIAAAAVWCGLQVVKE